MTDQEVKSVMGMTPNAYDFSVVVRTFKFAH